jgi:hypothetical protein
MREQQSLILFSSAKPIKFGSNSWKQGDPFKISGQKIEIRSEEKVPISKTGQVWSEKLDDNRANKRYLQKAVYCFWKPDYYFWDAHQRATQTILCLHITSISGKKIVRLTGIRKDPVYAIIHKFNEAGRIPDAPERDRIWKLRQPFQGRSAAKISDSMQVCCNRSETRG